MSNSKQVLMDDLRQMIAEKTKLLARQNSGFAIALDEIGGLLSRYDPAPSPLLSAIDQKSQDLATYFYASYSDTGDLGKSILVYKAVKLLVRYILLMDRYYEVGNKKYERIARGFLQAIKRSHGGHLKYSVDFAIKQVWPFWEFEKEVKKRLMNGHIFTVNEIRHFNLFKSSDAPILYGRILDSELVNFNPNIALIMHYNQALLDIQDDFEDIEEDVNNRMPNTFILAATETVPYAGILNNASHARKLIVNSGAQDSVLSLVEQYNKLVKEIPVPPSFAFLKGLTRDYTANLLDSLNVVSK